jgi:hypothetical protein
MSKYGKIFLVLVLALFALYFAVAGWVGSDAVAGIAIPSSTSNEPVVFDGITFANIHLAESYRKQKEASAWFPWIWDQPLPLGFLASVGFSLFGGTIWLLKKMLTEDISVQSILLRYLFSGSIGLILFFIIIYTLNAKNGSLTFILIPLISGVFADETYDWLEKKFPDFLSKAFSKNEGL